MQKLFSNLATDSLLRKLRISDINLSNSKVFQSVKSAVAASNVQLLDLSACSFTNRQIEDLGEILAENCAIESLNLGYNALTRKTKEEQASIDKFVGYIRQFIQDNLLLTHLNLQGMSL